MLVGAEKHIFIAEVRRTLRDNKISEPTLEEWDRIKNLARTGGCSLDEARRVVGVIYPQIDTKVDYGRI